MKVMLTGNEAIARGAYEYGVKVAMGYPGTPSSEILENVSRYKEIYSEWSINEKVAMDGVMGAAYAGKRAMFTTKQVGMNVASDSFMYGVYTGANAGVVIVTADDPGMFSSQNEQDNRHYARLAKMPMLEPADSQEAKDFVGVALALSEQFDEPVIFRTVMRVSHSSSPVELCEPQRGDDAAAGRMTRDPRKFVATAGLGAPPPPHDRGAHREVGRVRRDVSAQPHRVGRSEPGDHHQRRGLRVRARGIPERLLPEAGDGLADPAQDGARIRGRCRAGDRGRGARPVPGGAGEAARRERRREVHLPGLRRALAGDHRGMCGQGRPAPGGRGGRETARCPHQSGPAQPGPVSRLPAPQHLLQPEQAEIRGGRRHRLLQPGRAGTLQRHRYDGRDGRQRGRGPRLLRRGHGAGLGGRDRRRHLLPLRHGAAAEHGAQQRQGHHRHPRQPHHGHDGPPGSPRRLPNAGRR